MHILYEKGNKDETDAILILKCNKKLVYKLKS